MTTLLLPPIVPSPFGKRFNHKRYLLADPTSAFSVPNESSTSLGTVCITTPRQVSANSHFSTASAPVDSNTRNDENHGLNRSSPGPIASIDRKSFSFQDSTSAVLNSSRQARTAKIERFDGTSKQQYLHDHKPYFDEDGLARRHDDVLSQDSGCVHRRDHGWPRTDGGHEETASTPLGKQHRSKGKPVIRVSDKEAKNEAYDFKRWADTFRRRKWHLRRAFVPSEDGVGLPMEHQDMIVSALKPRCSQLSYRGRLSDNSSRFLETLKTASLSNDSVSMMHRNFRWGPGHEGREQRSNNIRYSVDSDRPPTTSSLDEAATHRGAKRRQILQEIATSEEGYVADLRALSNLFSTLLASISTLSNQARCSVRQNVIEILYMHESLLHELHLVNLKAAARRWRDTASPRKFGTYRHVKWYSFNEHNAGIDQRRTRQTNSSLGHVDRVSRSTDNARTADPGEAAEVARLLAKLMPNFFIYEEYCAKYELMVHELAVSHRSVPSWSAYETGIEALAKSVIALRHRGEDDRKGLTVGDLLIKPIQRICRYPLLLADLLKYTPVVDCPGSHADIEAVLHYLQDIIKAINIATDNPIAKERIQRRWLLESRLNFAKAPFRVSQFRMLGHVILCGVLHVAYRTKNGVEGGYALCVSFNSHLLLAMPCSSGKFDILATILLSDIKVERADDTKGLQCHTALFSWKIVVSCQGSLYELLFSACSAIEEEQWLSGMQCQRPAPREELLGTRSSSIHPTTTVSAELRSIGAVSEPTGHLTRKLSVQRAATVANRPDSYHVIIRNTHKPSDHPDNRHFIVEPVNRSQSLFTTHRTVVMAPRRYERIRLEHDLADVWTRAELPYPGMASSRSSHIIRASAGSLVRKLSLASVHGPFARRSASLTAAAASRNSNDTLLEARAEPEEELLLERAISNSVIEQAHDSADEGEESIWPGAEQNGPCQPLEPIPRRSLSIMGQVMGRETKRQKRNSRVAPEDPAAEFYVQEYTTEERPGGRKRWSNPLGSLKTSAEAVRNMLYSSK